MTAPNIRSKLSTRFLCARTRPPTQPICSPRCCSAWPTARRTFILNEPAGLREANEKLYALNFPDAIPPTLVSQDLARLKKFMAEQGGQMIVKPLDGHGGESVFLASADDRNLNAILEAVTHFESRPIMAQRYLAEIRDGDKRLIVLDGEPLGCTLRVPRDDENRGNIHVGGNCVKAEITARDREICSMMRPRLEARRTLLRRARHHRQLPDRGERDLAHGNPGDRSARRRQPRGQGDRFRRVASHSAQGLSAANLQAHPDVRLTGFGRATAVARGRRDRYELRPPQRPDPCSSRWAGSSVGRAED